MHTLLGLWSLVVAVLAGAVLLHSLQSVRRMSVPSSPSSAFAQDWIRCGYFLILGAPLVSLVTGLSAIHHFAGRLCFLTAPTWDFILGVAVPVAMGLVALVALAVGVLRLALLARGIGHTALPTDPEITARVARIADCLQVSAPAVTLYPLSRPLALTWGILRPRIVLSTWMLEHLDEQELEAVLAHEVAHVARRDSLVVWLATLLRDAFCYLPTTRAAYRRLHQEKELICDDLAIRSTGQPLALASALAKVWDYALNAPPLPASSGSRLSRAVPVGLAHALVNAEQESSMPHQMEDRIQRLLNVEPESLTDPLSQNGNVWWLRAGGLSFVAASVTGLFAVQGASVSTVLAAMGCGPGSPLTLVTHLI
ncbi:MAG TPA: M56 family metallopeptidase [Chloroflexota bacterium]|nr:M56 family metallopeptidase [Chloroflexota bacterium]